MGRDGPCCLGLFCLFKVSQGPFPPLLKRSRYQTIVWINTIELALCQHGFIAQTFQVLLMCVGNLLGSGLLGGNWRRRDI